MKEQKVHMCCAPLQFQYPVLSAGNAPYQILGSDGGTCCLYSCLAVQLTLCWRVSSLKEARREYLRHSSLLCLEDGGSTFRRNVCKILRDLTDSVGRVLLEKLKVPHLDKEFPAGQSRDRLTRGCHNIYALLHGLFLNKPTECI